MVLGSVEAAARPVARSGTLLGMSSGEQPPIRIGNDERAAAMAALDEHLAQGRLDVEEYGERSAVAANAVVAADLAALFTDLPAPHPTLPGSGHAPVPPAEGAAIPPTMPHPERPSDSPGAMLEKWGPRLVAISPLIALLLFLATRQWWWFLLIPVVGALVYGGHASRS
jgi:Domain of unknown function (DUF1707)